MGELWVPDADEFTTWESGQPIAVVRLRCSEGHDICELWWVPRPSGPRMEIWGGLVGSTPHPALQEAVGSLGAPVNPDRPDDYYLKTIFTCPAQHRRGNYRLELDDQQLGVMKELVAQLAHVGEPLALAFERDREIRTGEKISHPSGAVAIAIEGNALLRWLRQRTR